MWLLFSMECVASLLCVFGVGYFLVKPFRLPTTVSVCFAPVLSIILLFGVSVCFVFAGVPASGKRIIAVSAVIAAVIWLLYSAVHRLHPPYPSREGRTWDCRSLRWLAATVAISSILGVYVYVLPLDSAASFFQGYDNYYHLSQVREYLNTGSFASLPLTSYPNLWHCLVAVVSSAFSQTSGSQICVAANVVNYLLSSFVVPMGVFSLLFSIGKEGEGYDQRALPFASIAASASCVFPWNFLCGGPLYALLAGWSVLPASIAIFILMVRCNTKKAFVRCGALFLVLLFGLVVGHPSTVFFAIVFLSPFCIGELYKRVYSGTGKKKYAVTAGLLFAVLVLCFWCFCLGSSAFSEVLAFTWPQTSSLSTALFNAAELAIRPSLFPQLVVAGFILVGAVYCLCFAKNRWLIASYLMIAAMYVVCVGGSGFAVKFASGFWYSDGARMAAMLGFAAMPLTMYGLFALYSVLVRFAELVFPTGASRQKLAMTALTVMLVPFAVMNYYPSFQIKGLGTVQTGYGYLRDTLTSYNTLSDDAFCYSGDEIEFADKVKSIVGDSKVINYPYDGSCYSYALNDLNVMYRFWYVVDLDKTTPINLLRMSVNEVSKNDSVRAACADQDAEYVMLLDYGHPFGSGVFNYSNRVDEAWSGLTSLTDDTPGFQIILREGDMRLYKIVTGS